MASDETGRVHHSRIEPTVFERPPREVRRGLLNHWAAVNNAMGKVVPSKLCLRMLGEMLRMYTLAGKCFPTARWLVWRANGVDEPHRNGRGRQAFWRMIRKVEAKGWLTRTPAPRLNASQSSNDYNLSGLVAWLKANVLDKVTRPARRNVMKQRRSGYIVKRKGQSDGEPGGHAEGTVRGGWIVKRKGESIIGTSVPHGAQHRGGFIVVRRPILADS